MKIQVYHNMRCSKSREVCELLTSNNIPFETIEYLKTPFTEEKLQSLIDLLGISPVDLVRKNEPIYKTVYQTKKMTSKAWIKAMLKHPELIQRPIVVKGKKAIIGRPVELILDIL